MKDSNSAFDEVFIRISLQNREFSLIIVYVGSAKASRVGHDPVYGRHAGVRERTNCRRLVFFLFFCSKKTISEQAGMVKRKMRRFLQRALIDSIKKMRF